MKFHAKNASTMLKAPTLGNSVLQAPTQVADVMTTDTTTMLPSQCFADAVGLMATNSFRHLLVVDEDVRLQGVISDRDVLRALSRTPDWRKKSVAEIMTKDSITTTVESTISTAVRLMLEMRINCLPVLDADGRVVGILTSTDLLKAYERLQEQVEQRSR